jgi:uncharacterized membrane protein YfhO
MLIQLIPAIIGNGGYLTYYGDYNLQQITFLKHIHEMVRSGSFGWDWGTDLGTDLIGSYSFYIFTSPFFWITIPFPTSTVIFIMPFILSLKYALAAIFAFLYIKRFVKSQNAALIGSLLYAFCGFQTYNIFFNHFHDVVAFFPLLLIAMEELITKNRKGFFALTVGFMAILNYFFFFGQVTFCIIYFIVRWLCSRKDVNPDFTVNVKKFLWLIFEAVLGLLLSMCILIPSYYNLIGNFRINEYAYGIDWLIYTEKTVPWEILRTMFMLPELPSLPVLFEVNFRWSSTAIYLPLFGMTGVLAFAKHRFKHWTTKISIICLICAFVPILNSSFYLFKSATHYSRWYYMPILIMSLMTAKIIDELREENSALGYNDSGHNTSEEISVGVFPTPVKDSWLFGVKFSAIVLAIFGLVAYFPTQRERPVSFESEETVTETNWAVFPVDPLYFWIIFAVTLGCLMLVYFVMIRKKKTGRQLLLTSIIAVFVCTATGFYYGVSNSPEPKDFTEETIKSAINLPIEPGNFYRIETATNYDNYQMIWNYPGIRTFHSVVNPNILNFYNGAGVQRDVGSRPEAQYYALRGLLSVKYYLEQPEEKKDIGDFTNISKVLQGFEKIGESGLWDIYENKHFIPMGFAYDYYITQANYAEKNTTDKTFGLINGLVLTDEQIEKYSDIMTEMPTKFWNTNTDNYFNYVSEKQENSCYDFEYDSYGFTAKITLKKESLVFFSIPYSDGWTATVNGKPAEIEKVDEGLMAIRVGEGEKNIHFMYETPGLEQGLLLSALSGIIILVIFATGFRRHTKDKLKKQKTTNPEKRL